MSYGIKHRYPRIPISKKVKGFIQLSRPFTMVPPILGGVCGGLIGYKAIHGNLSFSTQSIYTLIFALVTLVLLQFGTNVLNQAMEADLDKANKQYRPIPSGIISKEEGMWLATTFYIIALFRSYVVSEEFSIIVAVIMVISLLYSAPPFYLKKRLWLGYLALGLSRGFLGFLGTYAIFARVDIFSLVLATILGVYVFGANATKDFADAKGDAQFKIRTLPVVFGSRTASYIIAPFFIIPFIMVQAFIEYGILSDSFLLVMLLLPIGVFAAYYLIKNPMKETITENSIVWTLFYVLFAGFFVFFALSFLL